MEWIIIFIIITLLLKKPSNYLYCGIFAWTGDSNKKFNWDKFNILGILNNERGGDSCGRASGNIIQYGTFKHSDYNEFIKYNQTFPITEKVVIGHDRKASFGYAINEQNAQPVTIVNKDNEILFTLAHNGTIFNADELAKKYDINPGSKTDSQILAEIIYNCGFDVLEDYNGTAAFIAYDRRNYLKTGITQIYVYKGASKTTEYATFESEERPLYIFDKKNQSLYFSSISDSLFAIGAVKGEVFDMDTNKVYTFENGVLKPSYIEINRTNQVQSKVIAKSQVPVNYNGYYDDSYYDGYGNWKSSKGTNIDIENESISNEHNLIEFKRGRFYLDCVYANGIIHLSKYGYRVDKNAGKPFYFIDGVMLTDHTSYNEATRKLKGATDKEHDDILIRYSLYPLLVDSGTTNGQIFYSANHKGHRELFSGFLQPFFSKYKYIIENGIKTIKYYMTSNEIRYPENLFKSKNNMSNTFNETVERQVGEIMGDVLIAIEEALSELSILGDSPAINILTTNLNLIQDELLIEDNGNLCKKYLKMDVKWTDPF